MGRITATMLAAFVAAGIAAGAGAEETALVLVIRNGEVAADQRTLRVRKDAQVRLRVTSDRPTVLHLHGYGIELKIAPGQAGEIAFVAHATGRYPIHSHAEGDASGPQSHRHGAALAHFEVRPR